MIMRTAVAVLVLIIGFIYYRFGKKDDIKPVSGSYNGSSDYVEFIDVGQGDCALISSNGKNCLIDAGISESYDKISDELDEKGIKTIDLIIISHYHADHTGALLDIVRNYNVLNLMYPQELSDTNVSNSMLYAKKECLAEDGEFSFAKEGQNIKLGDFTLTVLYQSKTLSEENCRSVYVMAKIGDKKFLFTGDGETAEENQLLSRNYSLDCDVLKVAHHGGATSSSDAFLRACNPVCAVISCGEGNMYGHPHKETITRLKQNRIKTYITKDDGNIVFIYKDGKLEVATENK